LYSCSGSVLNSHIYTLDTPNYGNPFFLSVKGAERKIQTGKRSEPLGVADGGEELYRAASLPPAKNPGKILWVSPYPVLLFDSYPIKVSCTVLPSGVA
jgi:hypothetical protein